MRTLLLGAGRIGQAIARDLAADSAWEVLVADRSSSALKELAKEAAVQTVEADLSDPRGVGRLAEEADLVVGALPSFLGFQALGAVVEAGKDYVDISFFEEDPFEVEDLARRRGATVVVDCGLAPGCDHLILGHMTTVLDSVERFICYVGGLPAAPTPPWEYKAPFAPYDVLAEYVRPARSVEQGKVVTRPPVTEVEHLDFPGLGTLEAFNTDGLRTLLTTLPVPSMKEMTLRYPGHADKVRLLRESGFLSQEPMEIGGVSVTPFSITSKLLARCWELEKGEKDLTVMRVVVEGQRQERQERHLFDLLDRADPETGLSSMARTTGFTCAAVARLVASGRFRRPGVSAAEHLGQEAGCYDQVMADLAARGVSICCRTESLE